MATINFDSKNCVRCFVHIINICSAHIIASMTSNTKSSSNPKSKSKSKAKFPAGSNHACCDNSVVSSDDSDSDYELDDSDLDWCYVNELAPATHYNDQGKFKPKQWSVGIIECDPLKHAQDLVWLFCSSGQHRDGFQIYIREGNEHSWFPPKINKDGTCSMDPLPQLQLLRDVKTRWDSVYMMLRHLQELRPVSLSQWLTLEIN